MLMPSQDDTWAWERLIVAKPEMAEHFTSWDQLGGFSWARILSRRPEFADRCDWSKLKPLAWQQLLMRQPQFADKCDKWEDGVLIRLDSQTRKFAIHSTQGSQKPMSVRDCPFHLLT